MNPEIDKYIAGQDQKWQAEVLVKLRRLIHDADPEIEEKLKWGAAAFDHDGPVVWMFCAKQWVHFAFIQGALLDDKNGLFEEDDTSLSKAKRTIKFHEGQAIPESIILHMIKQAVQNNKVGKKIDFDGAKPGEKTFDLPHDYKQLLDEKGKLDEFLERPYYQQKGYVQWIEDAKTEATRAKRIETMLQELQHGQYMPSKSDRII